MTSVELRLRKPVERAIAGGHPWIYRDALHPFEAPAGSIATVRDGGGRFVARGLVDGDAIGVRVFTTRDEALSRDLVALRFVDPPREAVVAVRGFCRISGVMAGPKRVQRG